VKEKGAKIPNKNTYIEHYQKLKKITEAMRDIEELDIDQ